MATIADIKRPVEAEWKQLERLQSECLRSENKLQQEVLTYISAQYVCNLIWKRGMIFGTVDGVWQYVGKIKLTMTDTLRIPKWYTGIAVPLGFGLSFIYAVYFFLRDRLHLFKAKPQEPAETATEQGGAS